MIFDVNVRKCVNIRKNNKYLWKTTVEEEEKETKDKITHNYNYQSISKSSVAWITSTK